MLHVPPDIQLAAGINCTASNTFLELADGTQILSAGKAPAVLFSVGVNSFRMDFTVTKLLHGVDLVLGMNWLQRVNPLIDWTVPRMLLGNDDQHMSAVRGQWISSSESPRDSEGDPGCRSGHHAGPNILFQFRGSSNPYVLEVCAI